MFLETPTTPYSEPEDEKPKKPVDYERDKRHLRLLDGEIEKQLKQIDRSVDTLKQIAEETDKPVRKNEEEIE